MTEKTIDKARVQRTSAGLREALFDELDDLRGGKTNATKANATAKLATAIIDTVEMELSVHKTLSKMKDDAPVAQSLPTLSLASSGV